MSAVQLLIKRIEKPWGRYTLWPGFSDPAVNAEPIGEIWFDAGSGQSPELLIKYLFTSDRLSIQVHPDDVAAKAAGFARGKDEAWIILAAEPGAVIGLGTCVPISRQALHSSALDGSIVDVIDWKRVKAGDIFYSPAGTVHAIGAGITLIEVQQNVDLTYRLYDYSRPRDLHLDAGIAVADPVPFEARGVIETVSAGREILVRGGKFVIERWRWAGQRSLSLPRGLTAWVIAVTGTGMINNDKWCAGQCWMIDIDARIMMSPGSELLLAYPLPDPINMFD